MLMKYKWIGIIVVFVLGAGVLYTTHAHSQPSVSQSMPAGINTSNSINPSTQAPTTNQQTKEMASSLKTKLSNLFSQLYDAPLNSNYPSNTLKDVTVTQNAGGYDIHVDLNGYNDSIYNWDDTTVVYYYLYKKRTSTDINNVSVSEYAQAEDKYGNTQSELMMTTSLAASDADQVNWGNSDPLPYSAGSPMGSSEDFTHLQQILSGLLNCTGPQCGDSGSGQPAVE